MFSVADHEFMARALQLAEKGLYSATPNPRVGCVLVREARIVGEGWHERTGGPHAEIHALRAAGAAARGATAYVTLEPCAHHGRTPPCAEALVEAGVARVVSAMNDPNPQVAGQGHARLRAAGVAVAEGLLGDAARELNIGFVSRMARQRPWLRVKLAASLDGHTALNNGRSQWITAAAARRDGHAWRARACALLTGVGTVLADDPSLTVREVATPRQPLRIVLDSRCRMPPQARLLQSGATLVVVAPEADPVRVRALREAGAEVQTLPAGKAGGVDLAALLVDLAARGLNEIHLEAGPRLSGALAAAGLVDEWLLYLAPTFLGSGKGLLELPELEDLSGRHDLDIRDLRRIGRDIRILARPVARSS